jgi:hypothetical protein
MEFNAPFNSMRLTEIYLTLTKGEIMAGINWAEKEIDFLYRWAGKLPITLLVEKLNKNFQNNRSRMSVQSKINRLGLYSRTEMDYMTANQWAKEFGFNNSNCINVWAKKGLERIKLNRTHNAISIKAMKDFANKRPELFSHIPKDVLLYYFGEEITDKILETPLKRLRSQAVNINGKIYQSLREASRETKMPLQSLCREVKRPDSWIKKVETY